MRNSHRQKLLFRDAEVFYLKVEIASVQKSEAYFDYKRVIDKARLQQLQRGQQRFQTAAHCAQDEIVLLVAGFAKVCNYLVCRLDHSNDQMCSGLAWKLMENRHQASLNIYEPSKQNCECFCRCLAISSERS